MSISETADLFGKGLITPNGIIRHFTVFLEAEEVRKLVIPIGITRSERVKINKYTNVIKRELFPLQFKF